MRIPWLSKFFKKTSSKTTKTIIVADDVPVGLSGNHTGPVLMPFDGEPTLDEAKLKFQSLTADIPMTDDERIDRLTAHIREALQSNLCGPEEHHALQRNLATEFMNGALLRATAGKLLMTLQDRETHSFSMASEVQASELTALNIYSHYGRFHEVAARLRGQWMEWLNNIHNQMVADIEKQGGALARLVQLDWFIQESEADGTVYLSLAVTHIPFAPAPSPAHQLQGIIHSELLTEEQLRQYTQIPS